jgi:hypothetical protein
VIVIAVVHGAHGLAAWVAKDSPQAARSHLDLLDQAKKLIMHRWQFIRVSIPLRKA